MLHENCDRYVLVAGTNGSSDATYATTAGSMDYPKPRLHTSVVCESLVM